jgi:hypothetical protein
MLRQTLRRGTRDVRAQARSSAAAEGAADARVSAVLEQVSQRLEHLAFQARRVCV